MISRNGGHINPPLFDDWQYNKETFGEEEAKKLVRFRLAHVRDLQAVAQTEGILTESQVRVTEHIEAYTDPEDWHETKENLRVWKEEMPEEAAGFVAYDGAECSHVRAGICQLYRPVTNIPVSRSSS